MTTILTDEEFDELEAHFGAQHQPAENITAILDFKAFAEIFCIAAAIIAVILL